MSEKDEGFVPSSAFLAKKDSEDKRLKDALKEELWKELHVLKNDDFSDINIFVEDANMHLRHKCLIKILAPTLYADIRVNEQLQNMDLKIKYFPANMPDYEIEQVKAVYSELVILDSHVDFKELLESGCHSDVAFKVDDELFRCHKCILASRSEFFKLMFRGNWMETKIDVIPLKSISAETFRFILKIVYNDIESLPAQHDLRELLTISEMYNIDCLKVFLFHQLKAKYCHFFHNPCQYCITGTQKVLFLCKEFLYFKDLVQDCYDWILEHYPKILVTRQFSKFRQEVKDIIKEKIKESTDLTNSLQRLKDCLQMKARIPSVKSTDAVTTMVTEIQKFFMDYFFEHYTHAIIQKCFSSILLDDKNVDKNLMLLETLLLHLPEILNKTNCVNIYKGNLNLEKITNIPVDEQAEAIKNAVKFLSKVKSLCKMYVHKNYLHVKRTPQWKELRKNLKGELMEGSGFLMLT